jgi:hypothetical protein
MPMDVGRARTRARRVACSPTGCNDGELAAGRRTEGRSGDAEERLCAGSRRFENVIGLVHGLVSRGRTSPDEQRREDDVDAFLAGVAPAALRGLTAGRRHRLLVLVHRTLAGRSMGARAHHGGVAEINDRQIPQRRRSGSNSGNLTDCECQSHDDETAPDEPHVVA